MIKTNFIFGIKLLYQYDYIFNDTDALTIIRFDNVKILEFMYLKSYRGNEDIFYEALLNNRYNCVKFLFENCCPFDTRIYTLLENINMTTDYIYKKINNKKIKFNKFNLTNLIQQLIIKKLLKQNTLLKILHNYFNNKCMHFTRIFLIFSKFIS